MTYEEKRIIGTAIGKAYLQGAMWMIDAQHNENLSVKLLDKVANDYAHKIMAQIEQSIAAIGTKQ